MNFEFLILMGTIHRKRSGSRRISTILGKFGQDPLPLPILILVTLAVMIFLVTAPRIFSVELSIVKPTEVNTHLVLLAGSLVLVMLVQFLSSSQFWHSEGFFQFRVTALIVLLAFMGPYQNQIHPKCCPFGFML